MLLGGFSLSVSAKDTIDSSSMKVNILVYEYYQDSSFSQLNANNNQSVIQEGQKTLSTSVSNVALIYRLTFVNTDGKPLFKKGETYNFTANNLEFDHGLMYLVETKPLYISHGVTYDSNSNLTYFDKNDISLVQDKSSNKYRLELTNFTPEQDVYRMAYYLRVDVSRSGSVAPALCPTYGAQPFVFTVEQRSEEAGLLSGLIGWITNIFNKIGDIFESIKSGFTDMASGFSNVINSLLELPSKLWEYLYSLNYSRVYAIRPKRKLYPQYHYQEFLIAHSPQKELSYYQYPLYRDYYKLLLWDIVYIFFANIEPPRVFFPNLEDHKTPKYPRGKNNLDCYEQTKYYVLQF